MPDYFEIHTRDHKGQQTSPDGDIDGPGHWSRVVPECGEYVPLQRFGDGVDKYTLNGIPSIMGGWNPPVLGKGDPGRVTVVFLGICYQDVEFTDVARKLNKLPGVKEDMRLFLQQWKGLPDLNVVVLTDFPVEAKEMCKELFGGIECFFLNPTERHLRRALTLCLPVMRNVTRVVMQLSCHGVPGGFVLLNDMLTHTKHMCNTQFTKLMVLHGINRKSHWASDMICNPLQLTVYLDRCHAGDTFPMQCVFGIQTKCIEQNNDQRAKTGCKQQSRVCIERVTQLDVGSYANTHPSECWMHIVCVAACPPAYRTPESSAYTANQKPCGLFTYLMHGPVHGVLHKVTLNELIYGWNVFNSRNFSMVALICYYMDKNLTDKMQAGFYWSTNVECPGTEGLRIVVPSSVTPCHKRKRSTTER